MNKRQYKKYLKKKALYEAAISFPIIAKAVHDLYSSEESPLSILLKDIASPENTYKSKFRVINSRTVIDNEK